MVSIHGCRDAGGGKVEDYIKRNMAVELDEMCTICRLVVRNCEYVYIVV